MDRETSQQIMGQQLAAVKASGFGEACSWEIEQQDLAAFVLLRPRRDHNQSFLLLVEFDDLPRRAPSYVFVDSESRQECASVWPPGLRQDDNPPGICTPGTREFHEHYHVNDRQYPWSLELYPVLQTLAEIQRLMERQLKG